MTRKTEIQFQYSSTASKHPTQSQLDKFWDWIDGTPATDELWRLENNGDMILVVDEELLTKILFDDENKAFDDFGTYEERESDTGAYEVFNLPDELCGTYTIRGIYNAKQELVSGDITYFFSEEF